jgi:hypothetical protein
MIVKMTHTQGKEERLKVKIARAHGCNVLIDEAGRIYGSGDWFKLRGRIVYAAPHERENLPTWAMF